MVGGTKIFNISHCGCNRFLRGATSQRQLSVSRQGRRSEAKTRVPRRQWHCRAASALADQEDPLVAAEADPSSPAAIQKYLASIGWQSAWIDGVVERVMKRQLVTTSNNCQEVVEYLMSEGLSEFQVCNMVSLCYEILSSNVVNLQGVVAFMAAKGVTDIPGVLSLHPKLLAYSVAPDNKLLVKGKMRAAIVTRPPGGVDDFRVVIFREGAAFNTAPVTPWKPDDL
ncbi:hypothetical protein BSKO_04629 [Bryopsis sp. KO-2023]|nr:hypothetical protein BSKO_04629 [Bryopsis sp. KO-2023]